MHKYLILLLFTPTLSAQNTVKDSIAPPPTVVPTSFYTMHTSVSINSNAIDSRFLKHIIMGGNITPTDKDNIRNRINKNLQIGVEMAVQAGYSWRGKTFDDSVHTWHTAGYEYTNIAGVITNKNVWNLAMYGNTPYLNQPLPLHPSSIKQYAYQSIYYGYTKENKIKNIRYQVIGKLIAGLQHKNIQINSPTNLFTSLDSDYIDASLDWKNQTTASKNIVSPKGIGAGADLHIRYKNTAVEVKDIGVIHWQKANNNYTQVGEYRWSGFYIPNILNIDTNLVSSIKDTVNKHFSTTTSKNSYTTSLPSLFSIHQYIPIKAHLQVNIGVSYRLLVNQTPVVSAVFSWAKRPSCIVYFGVRYGGYTNNVNTTLGIAKNWNKASIKLLSIYNEGWYLSKRKAGVGFSLTFNYNLL